ncbi:LRRF2 protein, partial [Nicator chloris]|nr:LRRF2 protein [Nicator chloris]
MGTPGSGRKRTPVKDRFSAEDEALSNIAREAEARLAAKRAARAEARDIRMRELERQQKEFSQHSYDRKWAHIQKWMEDAERARYSHRSSRHSHLVCVQTKPNQRKKRFGFWFLFLMERMKLQIKLSFARSTDGTFVFSLLSFLTPQSGIYYEQRNYSSLGYSKPVPSYHVRMFEWLNINIKLHFSSWVSPLNTGLIRHIIRCKHHFHGCLKFVLYGCRIFWFLINFRSFSGVIFSSLSPSPYLLKSSDFSDQSGITADYFSRSNRRGSIVSDADDGQVLNCVSLEEKSEKSHSEIFSRPSSRNSVSAAPLSGNSSRRGSGDASSLVDPDASLSELRDIYDLKDQIHDVEWRYMQGLKELKDSLAEVEDKYKKAMVSNAQLDNEKNNLIYQVDTLKDVIEEKEEQIAEFCRENEEKAKELERQKHTCSVLQHKLDELKEGLRQRDELIEANQRMQENIDSITKEVFDLQETINWKDKKIGALERQKDYFDCIKNERDELREELADLKETMKRGQKHGLVIIPDGTPNGDVHPEPVVGTITVISQEAAQILESAGEGPL